MSTTKITGMLVLLLCLGLQMTARAQQSAGALVSRGTAAGIEADMLDQVRARAAARGLHDQQIAALLDPPVVLAEQGLPAQIVLQKTLEGLAKGVAPERILAVLQDLRQHTVRAGELADPWLRRPEVARLTGETGAQDRERGRRLLIESITHVLAQEIPSAAITQLMDQLPAQARRRLIPAAAVAVAVSVMPDLPTSRTQPGLTAQLLVGALEGGFTAEDMKQLPAALQSAQHRLQVPAELVARGAAAQMAAGTPAAGILNNLFQGNLGSPGAVPPGLNRAPGQERNAPGRRGGN